MWLSFAKTASDSLSDDPCSWERPNTPGDWWAVGPKQAVSIPPTIGAAHQAVDLSVGLAARWKESAGRSRAGSDQATRRT